jgi:predicted DNA-binding protein (MmcQ/YjbR family)
VPERHRSPNPSNGANLENRLSRVQNELRQLALSYPEVKEDFPWGDRVYKVGKKIFLFLGGEEGGLGLSVKLPQSRDAALMFPFAQPTGYNLGKSGWVSAEFARGESIPLPMIREWIDESYRAIAPRKLVRALDERAAARGRGKG